jgi:3-phenylpropionate/trans-cinnamate dioxygenase ferredoxin reductase subunit
MTVIILGGGVAGFQAAAACRAAWPERPVTLIDSESETGYYRTLLPQFMAGALPEEKLFFRRRSDDPLLSVRPGLRARSLDRAGRTLTLSNGESLSYDRLVLAHGGDPVLPGVLAGPPCRGVFPVRDLTTARATRAWLEDHRNILVFGGSLVAVKTAVHLRQAGFAVSIVVRRGHLLLRALSPEAAALVEEHLRGMGIGLIVNAPLEDLRSEKGAIAALKAGGRWIDCDTLLVAAGTAPDISFLEGTGLLGDGGELTVSPALQTADTRIFAAGDVAVLVPGSGERVSPNTWPQALSQGKRAGENLYRGTPLPLTDLTGINAMDLHGLAMVVLGPPVAGMETIVQERPAEGVRRELFIVDGKPVGGSLIGDISGAGTLHALIHARRPLDGRTAGLLRPQTGRVIRFPEPGGRKEALILTTRG